MNVEDRLALVRQVGEEIVTEDELRALLEAKAHPIAYDGFEPSGTIHIAQGVLRAINVNKMTKAGARFKMFIADWHAWANNKMGGDLERIQTTGRYIQEIWKATGMDLQNVDFVWASEFVTDESYWKKVMNIARDSSLDRVLRTTQIMGRSEKDKLTAAQILYPCMQAADIFHLKADITQLGMDQRKVNMLAREVGPKLGFWKPVVVSHHMLMGLQQPPPSLPTAQEVVDSTVQFLQNQFQLDEALGGEFKDAAASVAPRVVQLLSDRGHGFGHYKMALKQMMREAAEKAEGAVDTAAELRIINDDLVLAIVFGKSEGARAAKAAIEGRQGPPPKYPEWARAYQELDLMYSRIVAVQKEYETYVMERATAMKMSKSNPDSAIFMTDSVADVERKLKNAYCPAKVVAENPVLEYLRFLVFERFPAVAIERSEKFGGNVSYHSYADLERDFAEGKLHPMDAKKAVAKHVNELLQPVRDHFERDEKARKLKEQVESFQVTR